MDVITILPLLPPLLLVPAMGILSSVKSSSALGCELRRKALHVGVGLTSLSFPLILTESWMVLFALSMIGAWMIAVRRVPMLRRRFGAVLHDAKRISHGELYFALAIAGLMLATSDRPLLFVVPVLILTISDAAAAIVGRALPRCRLTGLASGKTASGCAAFLATAFLITLLGLNRYTGLPLTTSLAIAAVVATGTCIVEAVSHQGRDNLFVPATAFVLLRFMDTSIW
jgi:phytol kinase